MKNNDLFIEERRRKIIELVNKQQRVTVDQLVKELSFSPATIRNDLKYLENKELLRRTHGGAIPFKKREINIGENLRAKTAKNQDKKIEIGKKAATLVDDNSTIAIDAGSTTFRFAKELVDKKNLTILTNDLQIAVYLDNHTNFDIFFAGGKIEKKLNCCYGSSAINQIKDIYIDKCFMSAESFDVKKGFFTPNLSESDWKINLLKVSDYKVMLIDSSKIGQTSFKRFAKLENFNCMIMDKQVQDKIIEEIQLENPDIKVIV
ncbi:MAG: DeoR/GlpR family DNA-binding transcription regulator [Tissierellia bacterium]|nr:DeoR/GlpR family DNA-binding transcription regulator [Tissierellia bacterium]